MRKRREIQLFSISFLDLLSGALGAVIILYVAIPKNKPVEVDPTDKIVREQLSVELASSKDEVKKLQQELEKTKENLAKAESLQSTATNTIPGQGANLDIGFKFKGQTIVFLIDTSYSMVDEDRIGQVKAGIKMLITSLPVKYKIEVVQYPLGERAPFKTMWGTIREATSLNKMDAFDFVYALRPSGGTPTRDALLFVLRNYENVSDIVLLSDGAPTLHNSNKKDDIYDILRAVRESNPSKVQINTIGVGSEFIKDKTSDRYKFLSLLSEQSGGFFVGF